MNEWISVEDRLPERDEGVIVAYENATVGRMVWFAAYYAAEGYWRMNTGTKINPSHWMPFPEPPSEEEQTEFCIRDADNTEPVMTITLWGLEAIRAFWARGGEH